MQFDAANATLFFIAFAAVQAAFFLFRFAAAGVSAQKSFVKLLSVGFLAVAAALEGVWVVAIALAFGALGDLALSRPGNRALLLGMGAFGAAHLVYVFLLAGAATQPPPVWPALALLAFSVVMALRLWPRAGSLRWAVMGYIALIAAVGLAALSALADLPLAALAAALFIASDSLLSEELFGNTRPAPRWRPYAIWATYWTAQFLFLAAFLRISHLNL